VSPPHVLLVEDDPDTREMYSYFLRLSGLRVTPAENGLEALQLVRRQVPDIVVTDLAMPVMDGVRLCQLLRTREETREIPIVAVTGQGAMAATARVQEAGWNAMFSKPCLPETLVAAIHELLDICPPEDPSAAPRRSRES
jgi:CheY-like chemotaxis protein